MDIVIAKTVADLIKPVTEPLSKRLLEHRGTEGAVITAALENRLAQVLATADIADLSERMMRRSNQMSIRKQLNYENAISLALELAAKAPEEGRRSMDADWFTKWSEAVQDVSDDLIQSLWAQAFARQIDAESAHISLRALDTLRLMEHGDAVSFMRVVEVLDAMGVVLVNSNNIVERIIKPENFDALFDLRLVEFDNQTIPTFTAPGGYTLYFELPAGFVSEPVKVIRMTARGRELAQTLPADQEADYPYAKAFDPKDPMLIPAYLSLVANNFGPDYKVSLSLHTVHVKRIPGERKARTHEWNQSTRAWRRIRAPDHAVDPAILVELERKHPELEV